MRWDVVAAGGGDAWRQKDRMLSVMEKAGVVAVGQAACAMGQMACDSRARMEGQDKRGNQDAE